MDKVDDVSHQYTLGEPYMVAIDDQEDDVEHLTAENTDDSNHDGEKHGVPLREQDRFLPIANVAKIMKKAIPEDGKMNSKIAKDARECVQECVSEFISFITSEASDRCHMEKRKTINGEDILFAMNALGFENYVDPLKLYLAKYREAAKNDKNLTQGDLLYEEMAETDYTAPGVSNNLLSNPEAGESGTVIYAFQDGSPIHSIQFS